MYSNIRDTVYTCTCILTHMLMKKLNGLVDDSTNITLLGVVCF